MLCNDGLIKYTVNMILSPTRNYVYGNGEYKYVWYYGRRDCQNLPVLDLDRGGRIFKDLYCEVHS